MRNHLLTFLGIAAVCGAAGIMTAFLVWMVATMGFRSPQPPEEDAPTSTTHHKEND